MTRLIRGALAIFLLASAGCRTAARDLVVERMDVSLTVLVDGSLDVEERLTVRFGETPSSSFSRYSAVRRHDGVFGVEARMDDVAFPPGQGEGRLEADRSGALDVRWNFAPVSNRTHVFLLRYRAANLIELSGIRGLVAWEVLPAARDYDVVAVNVSLRLPPGAVLLQDPWVDEAGWDVRREPWGMTASRTGLARTDSCTVGVEFTVDALAAPQPLWQYHRARAREFAPAFVSAGIFLIVVAAGILGMLRIKFARSGVRPRTVSVDAVPPALRVATVRGGPRGDDREALAAFRRLRDIGAIAADGDMTAATPIRKGARVPALTHHEQWLLDELWFRDAEGVSAGAIVSGKRRVFQRALLQDLVVAGLSDRDRVSARRDLWIAGAVVLALGAVAWWFVGTFLAEFGRAALAVPGGLLGGAVLLLVAAKRFSILSETGELARADWHKLLD
jgi:hypothetical protein